MHCRIGCAVRRRKSIYQFRQSNRFRHLRRTARCDAFMRSGDARFESRLVSKMDGASPTSTGSFRRTHSPQIICGCGLSGAFGDFKFNRQFVAARRIFEFRQRAFAAGVSRRFADASGLRRGTRDGGGRVCDDFEGVVQRINRRSESGRAGCDRHDARSVFRFGKSDRRRRTE